MSASFGPYSGKSYLKVADSGFSEDFDDTGVMASRDKPDDEEWCVSDNLPTSRLNRLNRAIRQRDPDRQSDRQKESERKESEQKKIENDRISLLVDLRLLSEENQLLCEQYELLKKNAKSKISSQKVIIQKLQEDFKALSEQLLVMKNGEQKWGTRVRQLEQEASTAKQAYDKLKIESAAREDTLRFELEQLKGAHEFLNQHLNALKEYVEIAKDERKKLEAEHFKQLESAKRQVNQVNGDAGPELIRAKEQIAEYQRKLQRTVEDAQLSIRSRDHDLEELRSSFKSELVQEKERSMALQNKILEMEAEINRMTKGLAEAAAYRNKEEARAKFFQAKIDAFSELSKEDTYIQNKLKESNPWRTVNSEYVSGSNVGVLNSVNGKPIR